MTKLSALRCWSKKGFVRVVVETPQGSNNKYKFDEETEVFKLSHVLPSGSGFPFEFGFIPQTRGEDGDPLDVVLLMEHPTFPGCLVDSRVIGVIEAKQTENGKTFRNDRLIAVPKDSPRHDHIKDIVDLNDRVLLEIEHFFESYNKMRGRIFTPVARKGAKEALALLPEQPTSR